MADELEAREGNALSIEEAPTMSAEIGEIAGALSKAQGAIESAAKSSDNPFFKSKYADLAEVWKAARKPLADNGLSVVQLTQGGPTLITVVTILAHNSGQWMRSELTLQPVKADPQGLGSAITYGRRYAMAAICGITQEDDDANAASGKNNEAAKKGKPDKKAPAVGSVTGAIEDTNQKPGETNGKKWIYWGALIEKTWYGTFSETMAKQLKSAKDSGYQVVIGYEFDGQYHKIKSLNQAEEELPISE